MASVRNRLFARIVRIGGEKLLDMAMARFFPPRKDRPTEKDEAPMPPRTKTWPLPGADRKLVKGIAGATVTRLATRSVPAAIVVGGGMLAKALYDRRRRRKGRNVRG